jgi:translocation and assembly module TamB
VVDSLRVEGQPGRLTAAGALGLAAGRSDTLRVDAAGSTSLGGLRGSSPARAAGPRRRGRHRGRAGRRPGGARGRRHRAAAGVADHRPVARPRRGRHRGRRPTRRPPPPPAPPDSLAGDLRVALTLAGSVDTSAASPGLGASGTLVGRELVYGRLGAGRLDLAATGADLLRRPALAATLGADSLRLGGLAFERADATFGGTGAAAASPCAPGAPPAPCSPAAGAPSAAPAARPWSSTRCASRPGRAPRGRSPAPRASRRPRPATCSPSTRSYCAAPTARASPSPAASPTAGRWPARSPWSARRSPTSARCWAPPASPPRSRRPPRRSARPRPAAADSAAGQRLSGLLTARVDLAGTRARPTLAVSVDAAAVRVAGAAVDRVAGTARYADRRLAADLGVLQQGQRVLDVRAALPVDLALVPVADRLGTDTVRATLRADSLDAALLAAAAPGVRDARGRVAAALDLSGTWRRPRLDGRLALAAARRASTRPASASRTPRPTWCSPATAWPCGAWPRAAAARATRWR